MTSKMMAAYVPIYGREEQTIRFIKNLSNCYGKILTIEVVIIDCTGEFKYDESHAGGNNCQVRIIKATKYDYWGSCINISLKDFSCGKADFYMLCNNDSYHFSDDALRFLTALVKNKVLFGFIYNLPLSYMSTIYGCNPAYPDSLKYPVASNGHVNFNANSGRFTVFPEKQGNSNVAPTVAFAACREVILKNKPYIPAWAVPHYLSDYWMSLYLWKSGYNVNPSACWRVLRFGNEVSAKKLSPWSRKSKDYIPAWHAFFALNASLYANIRLLLGSVLKTLRYLSERLRSRFQ